MTFGGQRGNGEDAMAEDTGDGGGESPWAGFGILGAVGAAQAAVGEIVTELTSFTKFQKRVDELIKDLKGSPASSKKVGEEPLTRTQFGGGAGAWHEADGLHANYQTVITQLESLSKLLSDSIEAMGLTVMASHKGYANIDTDIRDRLAAINAETKKHYGGDYHPEKPKHGADHQTNATGDSGDSGKSNQKSQADGEDGNI
jgi:hypothetical protein